MPKTPALVLGFNIHGLAVARALAKSGIEVHAITAESTLPSIYTRFATVHHYPGVNGDELVSILHEVATKKLGGRKSVVFPTSDRMVRVLSEHWQELCESYLLSWSHCRDLIARLSRKDELPILCEQKGVDHPATIIVQGVHDCEQAFERLSKPLLIKPARPLSCFKAIRVNSREELESVVLEHQESLPFVAQPWIEGGDDTLFFCTFYLKNGEELCVFGGRKLRSDPPALGQGIVMASDWNSEVVSLSRRFLNGMAITGPVSLEFKRDSDGRYWLIEPNVGRTEYCVDLLIQAGLNLPLVEYNEVAGIEQNIPSPRAFRDVVWFDTDKSPMIYLTYVWRRSVPNGTAVLPYYGHNDWRPFAMSLLKVFFSAFRRAIHWIFRHVRFFFNAAPRH